MIPVLRPDEVKAIDAAALKHETLDDILDRVGAALAREAIDMMGGSYGKRVVALAGPGLNGADARAAAQRLATRGVNVEIVPVEGAPDLLPRCDLVLDGAFGIGLSRPWNSPQVDESPVLAIDIPSGIDALTGVALGEPIRADRTVTFMGYKPGLLFGVGPYHCGDVRVVDIGLNAGAASTHVVEAGDVATWLPERPRDTHKWQSAVLVVAGSPGMTGAARLAAGAAMRAGAGYVHVDTAVTSDPGFPIEVVSSLGGTGVRADPGRFGAAVVGPGLGRTASPVALVQTVVSALDAPIVLDGDGLAAIAETPELLHDRGAPTVLTPHDGEYELLTGERPGPDRIQAAKDLASARGAVVLLKGPTTIVADPAGTTVLTTTGDARLATAGTGDVLSGIIGAFLAQGMNAAQAASAGAFIHGTAGSLGPRRGLIASDLVDLLPAALSGVYP